MQNRYGLSESQRPTLRAAPRREHQAPQMAEAAELDQACPDAEVQPGCQQDVNEEPSPKKRTHWLRGGGSLQQLPRLRRASSRMLSNLAEEQHASTAAAKLDARNIPSSATPRS